MIRVTLTSVLMALVALPHGICFCHYFSAAPTHEDIACCSLPAQADSQPTDDQDDDDADCPCKLREIPAFNPAAGAGERAGLNPLIFIRSMDHRFCMNIQVSTRLQTLDFKHSDCHAPLTLRALLI